MAKVSIWFAALIAVASAVGTASVAAGADLVRLEPFGQLPGVDVYGEIPRVPFQSEFSARYQVVNSGDDSYSDLEFIPTSSCHGSYVDGTIEFSELTGDGDAGFDPGEVWSFLTPDCVEWAGPWFDADIYVGGIEGIAASYSYTYPVFPVISVVDGVGDITVDACAPSQQTLTVENMTTNYLTIDSGLVSPGMVLDAASRDIVINPGHTQALTFNRIPNCEDAPPPQPPVDLTIELHGSFTDNHDHYGDWYYGGHWAEHDWFWCAPDQLYELTCGVDWHVGTITAYQNVPESTTTTITARPDPTTQTEDQQELPFTGSPNLLIGILAAALLLSGAVAIREG